MDHAREGLEGSFGKKGGQIWMSEMEPTALAATRHGAEAGGDGEWLVVDVAHARGASIKLT